MKTLVIYLTFEDENEEDMESNRRYMMESLWESGTPVHAAHQYRKATRAEAKDFKEVNPDET